MNWFMTSSRWLLLINAVAGTALILTFAALWFFYNDRIMPGTTIHGISISGLTQQEAKNILKNSLHLEPVIVNVSVDSISHATPSTILGASLDLDTAVTQAFSSQRDPSPFVQVWRIFTGYFSSHPINIPVTTDTAAVELFVKELKDMVPNQGQPAKASLGYAGSINSLEVFPGQKGVGVNAAATTQSVTTALRSLQPTTSPNPSQPPTVITIPATLSETGQSLTEEELTQARARAERFVGKSVELTAHELTLKLNDQELVSLLSFPTGFSNETLGTITSEWQKRIDRPAQEPVFSYDPTTLTVTSFVPPKPGLSLNRDHAATQLVFTLEELEKQAQLPPQEGTEPTKIFTGNLEVATTQPNTSLASTNNLGIAERIGFGDSEYAHSIPSRVHNVATAAKKLNNFIIKPGEEFSFNKALGDVSRATGYQPAYVISGGRTVLGDGGGVCQVSTTVFRSVLNAGLPVTKRKAHSYRVSYYELDTKPGVDATVYSGEVDLRFVNDTSNHILISTETDSENLYMTVELYGTSDGRTAEIVDHKTWGYRPPPAPVYIPDPSLPTGRTKQVDWAASGIQASFKNIVKDKDGNVIREEEYYSNYVPWSAKYLRGV